MKTLIKTAAILSSILTMGISQDNKNTYIDTNKNNISIGDISISYSTLNSIENELVYKNNSNELLSKLIWESKNTKLIGVNTNMNYKDFNIGVEYKTLYKQGIGKMEDYDWMDDSINDWTHYSNHINTQNTKVNIFDIKLNHNSSIFSNMKLNYGVGFKYENMKYVAYDGDYIYSFIPTGDYRTITGSFSGKATTYETKKYIPYINIGTNIEVLPKLSLILEGKYSNLTYVNGIDTHHFRDLTFEDKSYYGEYYSYEIKLDYKASNNLSFEVGYLNNTLKQTKGNTTITDNLNGNQWETKDSGGNSSKSKVITFSLKYSF